MLVGIESGSTLPYHLRPLRVEELPFRFVYALIRVRPKEVPLRLQQVRGQPLRPVAVVVAKRRGERRHRDAAEAGKRDDFAPVLLRLAEHVLEEWVKHEVYQTRIAAVRVGDAVQEFRADDAAAAPDGGDAAEFEAPLLLLAHGFDKIEALGVADDLARVEGVMNLLHKVLLRPLERGGDFAAQDFPIRARKLLARDDALL